MIEARSYNYTELEKDVLGLNRKYYFAEISSVGSSIENRELYLVKVGKGKRKVFFNAAHHGLEWMTSLVLVEFLYDYCEKYSLRQKFNIYDTERLFENNTLYAMPMVNPDGVERAINGGEAFASWQANAVGVDLNHNYDAGFDEGRNWGIKNNYNIPGPTRYGGERPHSEPETQAVVSLCEKEKFDLAVALHSQGEEIYWEYKGFQPADSYSFGLKMAQAGGYSLSKPLYAASFRGFKDWFLKKFGKKAYTVEIGKGKNPLPVSDFPHVYHDVSGILLCALNG